MAKFNKAAKHSSGSNVTTNHEGYKAYKLSPEVELYSIVCTASLSNKFYESAADTVERLRDLIKKCNHEYVAKLAVYAREQMYLRSIPLVLAVELAKIHKGDNLVRRLTRRVISRADELTEIMAYHQIASPSGDEIRKVRKIPNQLKLGVADAFNKFSEYQFAKYNRDNEIKLKDVMFLTKPNPGNDEEKAEVFRKISENYCKHTGKKMRSKNGEQCTCGNCETLKLETPYTWETELTKAGQEGKDKAQVWTELIDSGQMGYMAMLRNLMNFLRNDINKEALVKVCKRLSNEEEVLKSKQFPFRFQSAYRMIKGNPSNCGFFSFATNNVETVGHPHASMILNALEDAIQVSAKNIPGFGYDTSVLIACDVSGSMYRPISENSIVQNYDIGLVLGMLLQHVCKVVTTGIFGDTWLPVALPKHSILQNVDDLRRIEGKVGYSTNGWTVLDWACEQKQSYDKIMIFTDCQLWDTRGRYSQDQGMSGYWDAYKSANPNAKLYLFDLAGYGNTPLEVERGKDVYLVSGWSDKVFKMCKSLEDGEKSVDVINAIEL